MTSIHRATAPDRQPNFLMDLIVSILAPMFLGVTGGDIQMARMAAFGTVSDYRIRNRSDLIAIAQIIAFGLAAICALSLSMDDGLSVPDMLTLHRTANALNRSAQQNGRAIGQNPNAAAPALPTAAEESIPSIPSDSGSLLSDIAGETLAAESEARLHTSDPSDVPPAVYPARPEVTEKRRQAMWAIAMVNEASELTASLPHLPPIERRAAVIRAGALGSAANEILTGVPSMPVTPERHKSHSPAG